MEEIHGMNDFLIESETSWCTHWNIDRLRKTIVLSFLFNFFDDWLLDNQFEDNVKGLFVETHAYAKSKWVQLHTPYPATFHRPQWSEAESHHDYFSMFENQSFSDNFVDAENKCIRRENNYFIYTFIVYT